MKGMIPTAQRFIAGQSTRTVSARKLHEFLQSKQQFGNWIGNRIKKWRFQEGRDFLIKILKTPNGRPQKEYWLTIDMAKMLAMAENSDIGDQARSYFIDCEKKLQEKKLKQLPAPVQQGLSPEVLAAIHRQAQQVSLRAFESAQQEFEGWALRWHKEGESDEWVIDRVGLLCQPSGKQQIVSADVLWNVTSYSMAVHTLISGIPDRIHRLEQATGREWYGRDES